jgi:hypothetical protein
LLVELRVLGTDPTTSDFAVPDFTDSAPLNVEWLVRSSNAQKISFMGARPAHLREDMLALDSEIRKRFEIHFHQSAGPRRALAAFLNSFSPT